MKRVSNPWLRMIGLTLGMPMLASWFGSPVTAQIDSTTRVVVVTGDAAPGNNGTFGSGSFGSAPPLNGMGVVAFQAYVYDVTNAASAGIFLGDGTPGDLTQIVSTGEAAPGSIDRITSLDPPVINELGQVAFQAGLDNGDVAVFRGAKSAPLTQIARTGDAVPGGDGEIGFFFFDPSINDSGQVAFESLTDGGTNFSGIFRGAGPPAGLVLISGIGQYPSAVNHTGDVAFLTETGLFRGDGTPAHLVQLAGFGQPAPGSIGEYSFIGGIPALNDVGQVAFLAELSGTSSSTNDDTGVFLVDDLAGAVVAREGQALPDGNGTFAEFLSLNFLPSPALNNQGQVVFLANLTGDATGIYRGSGTPGSLIRIARTGQVPPDGNGQFVDFDSVALNEAGQVAFIASLTGTSGGALDDQGIYLFDDALGLIQVARTGQPLLGKPISALSFSGYNGDTDSGGAKRSGLNNRGEVAFQFFLVNDGMGHAIWSPALVSSIGFTLSPSVATNTAGTVHTLTASVITNGNAVAGAIVNFNVTTGPNLGQSGSATTSASGQGSFSYSGTGGTGVDTIRGIVDLGGISATGTATKVWIPLGPNNPPTAFCQDLTTNAGANCQASVPAAAVDEGSSDPDGDPVTRTLSPPGPYSLGSNVVMLVVADNRGATNACAATITVIDGVPPTINCPSTIITNVPVGTTNAVVNFAHANVSDNCSLISTNYTPPSGSTFPMGTNLVVRTATDAAGNTNTCQFPVIVTDAPPEPHDMAVLSIKAPKKVTIKSGQTPKAGKISVSIQNNSDHTETITNAQQLAQLVAVTVTSLGTNCAAPVATLVPPKKLPIVLAPGKKLKVGYTVTINCANDPLASSKTDDHSDYEYTVTVNHAVLGAADTTPANDICPRAPSGSDPGCGNKNKATGQLGADVLTDAVVQ